MAYSYTKDPLQALLWAKDGYAGRGYEFRKWELGATKEITYRFMKIGAMLLLAFLVSSPAWALTCRQDDKSPQISYDEADVVALNGLPRHRPTRPRPRRPCSGGTIRRDEKKQRDGLHDRVYGARVAKVSFVIASRVAGNHGR
jgi:hypothetical protein